MRPNEAAQVVLAYQAALTMLGAQVLASALRLWSRVNTARVTESSGPWLDEATDLIMDARVAAFELAVAFYRLHRALVTGETVRAPGGRPEPVELGRLRADFLELLPGNMPADVRYTPPSGGGSNTIPVAPQIVFDRAETAQRERAARAEARSALEQLGPKNLERKIEKMLAKAASVAEDERGEAFDAAGRRQAAAAERIAKNGARGATFAAARRDSRVLGYVRVSRTGTPCGWCAMLISRGPVYKSKRTAEARYSDGDLYHDNCKCFAVPVYRETRYDSDPLYELNRRYAAEWPKVTKGLSGKAAVRAWRRHIRRQQRTAAARPAQGAGSTADRHVQEA